MWQNLQVVGDPEVIRPAMAESCWTIGLSDKKRGIEPGFQVNESQIKILNGGFRLDVATTP
jgi:hypothetical protein